MAERTLIIEHKGTKYTGHVATIKNTMLGIEDHGIMSVSLPMEWPGGGVSFGGYALDKYNKLIEAREATTYGMDFIMQVMYTVGSYTWEGIKGKQVIALFDYAESGNTWGGMIRGIAHLTEDRVFIPTVHFEEWEAAHGEV